MEPEKGGKNWYEFMDEFDSNANTPRDRRSREARRWGFAPAGGGFKNSGGTFKTILWGAAQAGFACAAPGRSRSRRMARPNKRFQFLLSGIGIGMSVKNGRAHKTNHTAARPVD